MRCLISLMDMLTLVVLVEIVKTVDSVETVIENLMFCPTPFVLEYTNKVSSRKSFEMRIAERRHKNYGKFQDSEEPF